jgi:hypothetical protein
MARRALFGRREHGAPPFYRRPEGFVVAPDLVVFIVAAALALASAVAAVALGIAQRSSAPVFSANSETVCLQGKVAFSLPSDSAHLVGDRSPAGSALMRRTVCDGDDRKEGERFNGCTHSAVCERSNLAGSRG